MGESSTIENFELILKHSTKKPLNIYNLTINKPMPTIKPEDVLDTVYSQIKKIQSADRSSKNRKVLKEVEKSSFLSVSKLPEYQEIAKQTNSFDTQCVSDTQLINIIEDAEAQINTHKGMTQEFDTTFTHTNRGITHTTTNRDNNSDGTLDKVNKRDDNRVELDFTHESEVSLNSQNYAGNITPSEHCTDREKSNTNTTDNLNERCGTKVVLDYTQDGSEKVPRHVDSLKEMCDKVIKEKDSATKPDSCKNREEITQLNKQCHVTVFEIKAVNCKDNDMNGKYLTEDNREVLNDSMDFDIIVDDRSPSPVLKVKKEMRQERETVNKLTDHISLTKVNGKDDKNELNDSIEIDLFDRRSLSPVILVKKDSASLVVPLEEFERFEKIALSLINNNEDLETCKHLINSQILGGEFCLNTENGVIFNDYFVSPIVEKSVEIFQENKGEPNVNVVLLDKVKNSREKSSDSLKDEILFSSDEENDYIHRELQDMPLTAALKTSFYDHSNVLDETMFVGFQTASNKFIQICTESFQKAKGMLHDRTNTDFSLTELVEMCDEKDQITSVQRNSSTKTKVDESYISIPIMAKEKSDDNKEITATEVISINNNYKNIKKPETGFIGFKTASNKQIDLSDNAINISKKVFMDIEFDKNDLLEPQFETIKAKPKGQPDKNDKNYIENEFDEKIYDDLLIQEFQNIEMSLKENGTHQVNNFEGFKTASNRNIVVSDAAMAKMKNVFEDIDLGEIEENHCKSGPIKVLEKAVEDNLLQPIETVSKKTDIAMFVGFKTANNKNVNISAQALAKTKNIFQDIDTEVIKDGDLYLETGNNDINLEAKWSDLQSIVDINQPSTSKAYLGLKTSNNKHIQISDIAITKSKNIFNDNDNDIHKINIDKHIDVKTLFEGFKTASNKDVKISKQALLKSRKIFQDIDSDNDLETQDLTNTKDDLCGTAINKSVSVSEETIATSKKRLAEVNKTLEKQHCGYKIRNLNAFGFFQTARNNPVSVSKEAMVKSQRLFDDINLEQERFKDLQSDRKELINKNDRKICEESNEKRFDGFKTASNKNVNVSEEALAKCKKIFDDVDDFNLPTENYYKSKDLPNEVFQTANDKKVVVSKEAIEKTKTLFKDIEIGTFKGFQTASNKNVVVSEDAISKSKLLFQEIDNHTANKKNISRIKNTDSKSYEYDNNKNISFHKNSAKIDKNVFSFQTANNKNSNITEDALTKTRKLFDSIEKDNIQADLDINTQVLNNFEESLCTEDFKETPRNKRSGSPILSCPRAKKKRFETPYKANQSDKKNKEILKVVDEMKTTTGAIVKFNDKYKKSKKYTLKDLKHFENDKTAVDPYIFDFNLENILDFEFGVERNDITKTKMIIPDLKQTFLNAVNTNLVPEGWLDNHLKLILWKLISYEMKFRNLGYVCTVKNVIDQLKYRYDKELFNAERPTLRKIFEKDDVSTKTMVLCVAGILIDGVSVISVTSSTNIELLLTDGWYFIKATTDKMLAKLVYDRRIVVGCKIVTAGAEIANCEQGMSPWEDTSAVRLKLSGNSTRLAKWDSKLGYTSSAILSDLSSVRMEGGKIFRTRVYVARVYPLLYVEKFEDGSTVTRSERLEHLHQIKYESERELMMERIYEEVQKEFSEQESQDSEVLESGKRKCFDSGSQIAKMMKRSNDPMEFRAQLTSSQIQQLQDHTSKYCEQVIQAIQNRIQDKIASRNVVTLARGRIASAKTCGDTVVVTKGMLSIWKPNDAILDIFKEGSWLEIMNAVPTAMRYSEIQLTAGRQCFFRPTKCKNDTGHLQSLQRKVYEISDVSQNPALTTAYNEIDTVGIVFLIDPNNREFESSRNFQNVYLADADKNMICVNFWGGVKTFGFENILDTGQVVACANLQKRAGNTRKNIPQYRVTEFSYFTKTPKYAQAREMVENMNKKLFGLDRRRFCDDCIAIKNNYVAIRCLNNENESPYIMNKGDYSIARHTIFIDTPLGKKKRDDVNLNLTGLDFESTFKQDTQLSPKSLLRKKKVNDRIAKLKIYGEPPPLSPISIINKSANAKKSYKSPLLPNNLGAPSALPENKNLPSNCVANKVHEESPDVLARDIDKSPVISMKRSYVKRVPVKLNFSNSAALDESKIDVVDQFAEEFDGSPPLSLD